MEECFEVAAKMAHSKTAKPLKITKDSNVVVSSTALWEEINKQLGRPQSK
jgi:isocitrate/isopropylmalate dehydrogenase